MAAATTPARRRALPLALPAAVVTLALAVTTSLSLLPTASAGLASGTAPLLVSGLAIPGDAVDKSVLEPGETAGANTNRLSIGSDAFYDYANDILYCLPDRGPGGGVYSYKVRCTARPLGGTAGAGGGGGRRRCNAVQVAGFRFAVCRREVYLSTPLALPCAVPLHAARSQRLQRASCAGGWMVD